jgi:hypothetical protein
LMKEEWMKEKKMIDDILSILMFVMASMWTICILLIQIIAFSNWHRTIPYEASTKILNLITHVILLCSIWISVLGINSTANWILLLISLIPFSIWFVLSRMQNRYLTDKLNELKAELDRELSKIESYSAVIRKSGRKKK